MTSSFDRDSAAPSSALDEAVDVLLRFGALMLRAGNTAARTREWMEVVGRKLGLDAISVSLTLDCITASARHGGASMTAMRELGRSGIDVARIDKLVQLAKSMQSGLAPRDIVARLADIESTPQRYSAALLAPAIGIASGGFAFLNGAGVPGIIAAAIGGGVGQWLRSWLSRRQLNQYGVAALCAIAASGSYLVTAALVAHTGLGFARHPAGFIASVLFLVPGFPLLAGLLDLLRHQIMAAVSRVAYGVMVLLAVAFGLSIVIEVAGVDLSPQPPLELAYALKLLLRAIASFVAACAFAMLFNSPVRTVVAAGLVAVVANELRLALYDGGMMLAPAAFFGAFTVGLATALADLRFGVPRIAIAVPPVIIMVPGLYAYEMIVFFNQGKMLDALQASASCGFIIGALAMGLAVARIFSPRASR